MSIDYLMRQIETMSRAIAIFLLNKKDYGEYEIIDEEGQFSRENFLRYALQKLILENRLNEAENLLYETLDAELDLIYLPTALDFYRQLSALNDAELATANFSREEIRDGLEEIARRFNIQLPFS